MITENEITIQIMDSICDSISDNSYVVDVGFGNTILLDNILARKKGCNYIGVDTNVQTVNIAKEKFNSYQNIQFFSNSLEELDLPRVDVIIWSRIFHHLNLEQARKQFDIMSELLNDFGKIIIVDSIRDYSKREDRYSYTPIFFINEVSRAFKMEMNHIRYSANDDISVNQFWKLIITKDQKKFYSEIFTI